MFGEDERALLSALSCCVPAKSKAIQFLLKILSLIRWSPFFFIGNMFFKSINILKYLFLVFKNQNILQTYLFYIFQISKWLGKFSSKLFSKANLPILSSSMEVMMKQTVSQWRADVNKVTSEGGNERGVLLAQDQEHCCLSHQGEGGGCPRQLVELVCSQGEGIACLSREKV